VRSRTAPVGGDTRATALTVPIRRWVLGCARFGVWSGPFAYSWKWASAVGGHYWRIGDDIYDGWQSLMRMWDTLQSIPNIGQRTKPGAYTFLDQMLIGDVPGHTGTVTGPVTHFLVVLFSSSLLLFPSLLLT
jgi:hypothetical protein